MPHHPSPFASWFRFGLSAFLSAWLIATPAQLSALPTGAQVQQGQLTINVGGRTMTIDQQSPLAVINWNGFSIAANELVNIRQLGLDSALLNRVTGADPSQLFGQLSANGRVYVVNPNGVLIGPNARINTQQFIASALDVADQDFLNGGDLRLTGDSTQPVVNLGHVTAANGDAILIAQVVRNAGTIAAPNGTAALAAGREVLYRPDADQRIVIAADVAGKIAVTGVENTGLVEAAQAELKAAGGNVYDLAINQGGVVRATGVEKRAGRVLLVSDGGDIRLDGEVSAHDADGSGGEVLIGGDYRGENAAIANAARTTVTAGSAIDVSARADHADGGRAVVWANEQTDFFGKIEGRGGALGGDGAFAEVSGKRTLNYHGLADLTALAGTTGTLLLDPEQAVISADADDQANGVFNNGVLAANLASANVTVDASGYGSVMGAGDITVSAPVSWSSANTLTLKANDAIAVNADLTGAAGDIVLLAAANDFGGSAVTVDAGATITANALSFGQNPDATFPGSNPPPLGSRALGDLAIDGVLEVGTLDFRLENRGIDGAVAINNAANKIGTLTTSVTDGSFGGDFNLVDGDGGLTINGDFSSTQFSRDVTIVTPGNLTLASGTRISTGTTNGTLVLASTGGSFINNAGAGALTVGSDAGSRYLIYSDDPATTTKDGLTGAPVYNKTYAANAPGTITQTGNRFLYALAPTITLTADSRTRSYNTANPTLTATVSGLVGGDSYSNAVSGTPSLSTTATISSPVGTYPISIAQGTLVASDYGYQLAFVPGMLTVSPNDYLNISADNKNRFYGDANPTFTYTPTGFTGGDDASILDGFTVSFTSTATPNSPAGTYTITPSGASTLNNYGINYIDGTLTVDPRLLTITADAKSMNFLDSKPAYTATWSGLASFDTEADVPGLVFTDNYTNHAGSYTITPSGASNPNYAITFVPGTLTVNPRPITVTARDQSRTYGAANPTLTTSTSGQPFGSSVDLTGLSVSTTASDSSVAGTYAITLGGATNADYAFTYVPGTLTINPAGFTVQANNATRVYGDANPAFTSTNTGFVLSDTITDVVPDLHFTSTATIGSNVGTYTITPAGTPSANYDVSFLNGALTITKAPISLFALGQTHRTYGDANPSSYAVNVVGLKNGDTLAGGAIQYFTGTTATQLSGVGTYAVNFTVVSSANYSIPTGVQVAGTLVIDPRPLTITANSFTREYGDANPTLTATFDNLASFDTAASAFPSMTIATPATQSSGVLDYGINIFNATNGNYTVTTVPGTLHVTPAPISFGSADYSFMYGDNPTASVMANYTGGLKLSDTVAALGAQVNVTGLHDVGTYPVNVTLTNSNYYVDAVAGSITITPRPVYFSIRDTQRVYGDTLPHGFVVTQAGGYALVDPLDQVFQAVDPTTIRSDVGPYLVGGKLINSNYQLLGVDQGVLTITPRYLALKPENAGHTYGDPYNGVNYLVAGPEGLAPFDTIDDIVADTIYTQYTAGHNFGFAYGYELLPEAQRRQFLDSLFKSGGDLSYVLTPGGYQTKAIISDHALRNYYVVSVPGTVSVVPRPVTLTVDDAIGVKNNFINPFISHVENLAPTDQGQSGVSVFPDLTYELVPTVAPARVQDAVAVTDVPSAPAFTDADFEAKFDFSPATPPIVPDEEPDTQVDFDQVDPDPSQSAVVEIIPGDSISVGSKTVIVKTAGVLKTTPVDEKVDSRLLTQVFNIRPANFANDNYVVTQVKMGTLTIQPDPVEVGAAKEDEKIAALRQQLYDPGYETGEFRVHTKMSLGFTRETLPVAFDAILWTIEQEQKNGTNNLYEIIRTVGRSMVNDKNRSFQQFMELYLADLHTNPEKQAFLAGIMKDYTAALVRGDIVPETDAQRAYKERVDTYMGASKEAMARKIEEQMKAWENRNTPEAKELVQRQSLLKQNADASNNVLSMIDDLNAKIEQAGDLTGGGDTSGARMTLDAIVRTIETLMAGGGLDLGGFADAFTRLKEESASGNTDPAVLGEVRDLLVKSYENLQEQRRQIQSPEAIAARKALIGLTGQGSDMVQTLLQGDVPYEQLVNNAMGDLVEDSVNSYAAASVATAVGNAAAIGAVPLTQIAGNAFIKTAAAAAEKASEEAAKKVMEKGIDAFYKVGQKAAQEAFEKIAEKAGEKGLTKAAQEAALKAATEIGKKAAQEALEKAAQKAGEQAAKKAVETGLKKAVSKGLTKVIGKIFSNATESIAEQAASKMAGKLATTLASRASSLSGFAAGISFALSTGIERGIMIGKLADGEAYVKSLTENPASRDLKLRPDPNVEGREEVEKQNTRMKVDLAIFNVGFLNMISDTDPMELSSGYKL